MQKFNTCPELEKPSLTIKFHNSTVMVAASMHPGSWVLAAVENMMSILNLVACQLLLMRACARRAYCKKCRVHLLNLVALERVARPARAHTKFRNLSMCGTQLYLGRVCALNLVPGIHTQQWLCTHTWPYCTLGYQWIVYFLYFCFQKGYTARLSLSPFWKQKYQKWIMPRKLQL